MKLCFPVKGSCDLSHTWHNAKSAYPLKHVRVLFYSYAATEGVSGTPVSRLLHSENYAGGLLLLLCCLLSWLFVVSAPWLPAFACDVSHRDLRLSSVLTPTTHEYLLLHVPFRSGIFSPHRLTVG